MSASGPTFLTGATGFIGAAVARALLARGHAVRALVRRGSLRDNVAGLPLDLVEGDLTDAASLARATAGCRYVFHLAADYRLWAPDAAAMLRINVEGTTALMRAAKASGVERIVYCSSVAALGLTTDGTAADEDTPVVESGLVGNYKRSKYLAEQAVLAMVRNEGLPAVIVNPSAPVGPRDIKPTPTGRMILDAAAGRMPGYLETGINVVHVDDVAEGHLLALERGIPGERYILGGDNLMLGELFAMTARLAGRRPPRFKLSEGVLWPVALVSEGLARTVGIVPLVTRESLKMARKRMFFSCAKAVAQLGYNPRPAERAIIDAIAWFESAGRLRRGKRAA